MCDKRICEVIRVFKSKDEVSTCVNLRICEAMRDLPV